jgi:condensin complex subunit 2
MEPDDQDEDKEKEAEETMPEDGPIDMAGLAARFFSDLSKLDEQDICPSFKTFELGAGDGSLDLPFLKAPDNWRDEHPEPTLGNQGEDGVDVQDDAPAFGIDDDDDAGVGFDLPAETGFGEGGEAWARDAALQPQMRVHNGLAGADGGDDGEVGTFDTNSNSYGVTLQHRDHDQENILNYFDTALHKNWAGPEHWKIARIKEATKAGLEQKRVRKEKEPFEIDFAAPMSQDLANMLYTTASSNSQISLPRNQWRSKTRNLLPDDKHFNSKDLLKLFLKPKAKLGARKPGQKFAQVPTDGDVDEAYWATNAAAAGAAGQHAPHPMDDDGVQGDYDANFFQDDNLPAGPDMGDDDDDFADAREAFSPQPDGVDAAAGPVGAGIDSVSAGGSQDGAAAGAFGAQLVTQSRRLRPEYVQYARVAKKVDVRRLKENMWAGIGFEGEWLTSLFMQNPFLAAEFCLGFGSRIAGYGPFCGLFLSRTATGRRIQAIPSALAYLSCEPAD